MSDGWNTRVSPSRGTRMGPLSRRTGKVEFTKEEMEEIACIICKCVREEIKKEMAKTAAIRNPGAPVPIPNSRKFVLSWKWRVKGEKTIEIYSDWPTANAHTLEKERGPFSMTWLKSPSVVYARLDLSQGISIVRKTPSGTNFWIHPGFKKYNFLERGVRKGQTEAINCMTKKYIIKFMQQSDITR